MGLLAPELGNRIKGSNVAGISHSLFISGGLGVAPQHLEWWWGGELEIRKK